MGTRGPVPKRSNERLGHRAQAELDAVERLVNSGPVEIPPPCEHWAVPALDWYVGLQASAVSKLMEPSDWAAAKFVAEGITRLFEADNLNASLYGGIWRSMNDLLTTESARRRLQIEVERHGSEAEAPASVAALGDYLSGVA